MTRSAGRHASGHLGDSRRHEHRRRGEAASCRTAGQRADAAQEPRMGVPLTRPFGATQSDHHHPWLAALPQHDLTRGGLGQARRIPRQQVAGPAHRRRNPSFGDGGRPSGKDGDLGSQPFLGDGLNLADHPRPPRHGHPLLGGGCCCDEPERLDRTRPAPKAGARQSSPARGSATDSGHGPERSPTGRPDPASRSSLNSPHAGAATIGSQSRGRIGVRGGRVDIPCADAADRDVPRDHPGP